MRTVFTVLVAAILAHAQPDRLCFGNIDKHIRRLEPKLKTAAYMYLVKCDVEQTLTALRDSTIDKDQRFPSRTTEYHLVKVTHVGHIKGSRPPTEEYHLAEIQKLIAGSSWVFEMKEVILQGVDSTKGLVVVGPSKEDPIVNLASSAKVIPFEIGKLDAVKEYFSKYRE